MTVGGTMIDPLNNHHVSEQDVEYLYQLLLAREPESQVVVMQMTGQPLLPVIAAFMGSSEFQDKLGIVNGLARASEEMLTCLDYRTVSWMSSLFNLAEFPAGVRVDRLTIARSLLQNPAVAERVDTSRERSEYSSKTLLNALDQVNEVARVVAASSRFNADYYLSQSKPDVAIADPALHYVMYGEAAGLKPSTLFDPLAYRVNNPDLHHIEDNLLYHFEMFGEPQGRVAQGDDTGLAALVETIRASPLFDEAFYRAQVLQTGPLIGDPASHYLVQGERRGLKASDQFDAAAYEDLYPDIAASDVNRLVHYERFGRLEGRVFRSWMADHRLPPIDTQNGKPVVILLLHEATYTGAPILGWNLIKALSEHCNIVVVLRRGGALEAALRQVATAVVDAPPREGADDPDQLYRFARKLKARYNPLYVIANSVETRLFAVALRDHDIPIIALIHEFWPGARPGVRLHFYSRCAGLVFPAHVVEESSFHAFREIGLQNRYIEPQGPSAIPPFDLSADVSSFEAPATTMKDGSTTLDDLLNDRDRDHAPFTVIGLGAIEMRKGVDLFIATATALKAKHPDTAFRFIWIGTWEHALGTQYAALLEEQYQRSGLAGELYFFPTVDRLDPVYARADTLLLSSRLDPLPNITIDAAIRGIPVVCFDQASGMAELLKADPETAALVVPHLDTGSAADRIAMLAGDANLCASYNTAMRRLAARYFDMPRYAARIHELGCQAAIKFAATSGEQRLIEDAGIFDHNLYFAVDDPIATAKVNDVATYLDLTKHINYASPPVFGMEIRRPTAGFHPFIYGTEAPGFPADGSRDALAHYVEAGSPRGRWSHQVLRPDQTPAVTIETARPALLSRLMSRVMPNAVRRNKQAIALHGHFHYTDNVGEFMDCLSANTLSADLYLTATSVESAEYLSQATAEYSRGKVVIEIERNIGRDIYSFLKVMKNHVCGNYDLVCHVHGKRSLHTLSFDQDLGNRWRRFLWEHLLGPTYRSGDLIVDAMNRDDRLGLVFPENDYLIGWEKNNESAAHLARRLGIVRPLPGHIEFPVGTMFWAKVKALDKLVRADLREDEMPPEPLPIDGTLLHALERMLPILCEDAGFRYATTYIPHIRR